VSVGSGNKIVPSSFPLRTGWRRASAGGIQVRFINDLKGISRALKARHCIGDCPNHAITLAALWRLRKPGKLRPGNGAAAENYPELLSRPA
jgi:hypothetical protein